MIWDDVIDEQTRLIYERAGFGGQRIGLGQKPALLIIDVVYAFVGDKPEPVLKSTERFPLSCGEVGWQAVRHITVLLPLARQKCIPIIYATPDTSPKGKGWIPKKKTDKSQAGMVGGADFVRGIAPLQVI